MRLRTSIRAGSALLILALALSLALAPEFGRVNRVAAQTATYVNTQVIFCGTLTTFTRPTFSSIEVGTTTVMVGLPGVITITTASGPVTFLIPSGTLMVGTEQFVVGGTGCFLIWFGSFGQVIKVEIAPFTPTPGAVLGTTSAVPVTTAVPLGATLYTPPVTPTVIHRVGRVFVE